MQKSVVTSVCITSFLSSFMGSSINIAIPFMADDYAVAPESITWVFNAFTIAAAAFLLPATALANRFGFVKIYSLGTVLGAFATFLVPFAPTFACLVLFRAFQGLSFALFFCTGMAVLVDKTPPQQRAAALAITISAVYAGLSLSPLAAGLIVELLGWAAMFHIAAAGLFFSFLLSLKIHGDPGFAQGFPAVRMTLCFTGASVFLISLSVLNLSYLSLLTAAAALAVIIFYLVLESKSTRPLFPVRMVIENRVMSLSLMTAMLNFVATFAIGMLISMHMQIILGISAIKTGLFLTVLPAVMLVATSFTSKLTAMFGTHLLTTSGVIIMALGVLGFVFMEPATPYWYLILCQALIGLGNGLFSAPNSNIIMSSVSREQYALASSLQALVRMAGMGISMVIVTVLLNSCISATTGTTLYVRELTFAISLVFKVSTVICAAAAITEIAMLFLRSTPMSKKNL